MLMKVSYGHLFCVLVLGGGVTEIDSLIEPATPNVQDDEITPPTMNEEQTMSVDCNNRKIRCGVVLTQPPMAAELSSGSAV
jgi:hypothetical protein